MIPRFGGATILAILFLVLFATMLYLWILGYRRGRFQEVRPHPLPPMEALRAYLRRAAEMGDTVHLSPGGGTLDRRAGVAETLAGLEAVDGVTRDALALGVPLRVTTNDALVNVVAENLLERGWQGAGRPAEVEVSSLMAAQQDPIAYAASVVETLGRPDIQGNVIVGDLAEELLLIGEVGANQTRFQVLGAVRPAAISFLPLVTDHYLIGEEVFSVGAYLDPKPSRLFSLLAQDGLRMILLLLILLGVLLATLGGLEQTIGRLFLMPVP